jgi:hypothetical protein
MPKSLLVGLAATAVFTACGTASTPKAATVQSASAGERAQFIERADALCKQTFSEYKPLLARAAALRDLPPRQGFVAIRPTEERFYAIARRGVANLRALRLPADGAQTIQRFISADAEAERDGEKEVHALAGGRPAAMSAAAKTIIADVHRDRRLAGEAGLKDCG